MRSRRTVTTVPVPSLREAAGLFVRVAVLIRPYWGGMTRGLVLSLFVGSLALVTPYMSKLYFDNVYPARDLSLLHALVAGVAAFALASALMGAVRTYYSQIVSAKLGSAMSLMYFNHLQHLPMRFFEEHRVGEVISRISDMRSALGTVAGAFQTITVNGVYLILVPPFLLALDWKLSLLSLITTPVMVGVSTATSRITRRYMKRTAEAVAELSALQVETLSQIRTLKAMAAEPYVFAEAAERAEEVLHLQLKAGAIGSMVGIVNGVVRTIGTAAFTWYAWTLILNGEMSLGSFVAFGGYLGYLTGPVGQVASLFADFQQSAVTLGRAFEYLDLNTEQPAEGAYAAPAALSTILRGDISFEHVAFGYSSGKAILQDLSLEFKAGTVTAIVGTTGAGKSTILRLLCRMEQVWSGAISIDGIPIDTMPLSDLRRQIGVVWQEPTLLRGTIWENLTIGIPDISRSRVEMVVRACQLETLILDLPAGYDTIVAEWGASVSGGQRQRFALARALLRDTPILLLDETTSQVDVRTEESILREILPIIRGRTVLLVTHRLITAALADRICVMENGSVVGLGSHDELLRRNEQYRQLNSVGQRQDGSHFRALYAT